MFATVMPTVSTPATLTAAVVVVVVADADAETGTRPSRIGAASSKPASKMPLRMAWRLRRRRRSGDRHASAEALDQVIADTQGVRGDGQRRIHGSARTEEAAIDDVEIVDVVGAAMHVQRRRAWIAAEADGAVLMRHAGERNTLADEQRAWDQMFVQIEMIQQALQLADQPAMRFFVVGLV